MAKYSIISRKRGMRRAYSDGYIYGDLDYAKREAQSKALSGHYTMVKIVDNETNEAVEYFTKAHR